MKKMTQGGFAKSKVKYVFGWQVYAEKIALSPRLLGRRKCGVFGIRDSHAIRFICTEAFREEFKE